MRIVNPTFVSVHFCFLRFSDSAICLIWKSQYRYFLTKTQDQKFWGKIKDSHTFISSICSLISFLDCESKEPCRALASSELESHSKNLTDQISLWPLTISWSRCIVLFSSLLLYVKDVIISNYFCVYHVFSGKFFGWNHFLFHPLKPKIKIYILNSSNLNNRTTLFRSICQTGAQSGSTRLEEGNREIFLINRSTTHSNNVWALWECMCSLRKSHFTEFSSLLNLSLTSCAG